MEHKGKTLCWLSQLPLNLIINYFDLLSIKSDKMCSFICASERIAEVVRNTGAMKVVNSGSAKNQILIECLQHTLVATQ